MVRIYCRRIKAGTMTPDDVPLRWRDAVGELLDVMEGYKEFIHHDNVPVSDEELDSTV